MANNFQQGYYIPKNPEKYKGDKTPYLRSSWERHVSELFDTNPHFISWASEPFKIPYQNPFTGKHTVYVPDFIVTYIDAAGKQITEIIEVKPEKETFLEKAKSEKSKLAFALNMCKWTAAKEYASRNGIGFRVMTEESIFNNPKGKG